MDLRAVVGKREFKFGGATKDASDAQQRHAQEPAKIEAQLANLRKPSPRISLTEFPHATAYAYERCAAAEGRLDDSCRDLKSGETMRDEATDRINGNVTAQR
ncbi:hypothetical protein [Rhodoblastus sp.]|uniref:hypothetical protein n=1 Tax=Rhodoblastus sp. TaxID=1962975 RepID=UPI002629D476|nr:hypothetical protein [Rhodoblastus sp.]